MLLGNHAIKRRYNLNLLVVTIEIVFIIVIPILILYIKSNWSLRVIILCCASIPILWYFTYAPIHELSHVAGAYLVGRKVTYIKLIPSFWKGEVGRAWINSVGLSDNWRILIEGSFPYLLDVVFIIIGIIVLQKYFHTRPFLFGFLFMLLCLRPTFDLICETITFLSGNKGDLYFIHKTTGTYFIGLFLTISIGLGLFSIYKILKCSIRNSKSVDA